MYILTHNLPPSVAHTRPPRTYTELLVLRVSVSEGICVQPVADKHFWKFKPIKQPSITGIERAPSGNGELIWQDNWTYCLIPNYHLVLNTASHTVFEGCAGIGCVSSANLWPRCWNYRKDRVTCSSTETLAKSCFARVNRHYLFSALLAFLTVKMEFIPYHSSCFPHEPF